MSLTRKILIAVPVLLVAVVLSLILAARSIQRSFFYPKPHGLPPIVDPPTEQLLTKLEAVLVSSAPSVAKSLQPGLSDIEIAKHCRPTGIEKNVGKF